MMSSEIGAVRALVSWAVVGRNRLSHVYIHQVVDYGWDSWLHTPDVEEAWLQFDFQDYRISPTDYTLRSGGDGGWHLLQWTLKGTMEIKGGKDETVWDTLDSRDTRDMVGSFATKTFSCQTSNSARFYRYLRITRGGCDSNGSKYLRLAAVEFFGRLASADGLKA
jgi:hypothetical protein